MIDISEFRKLVPAISSSIYLNHASVSPPPLPVLMESIRVQMEISMKGSIAVNELEKDDLMWAREKVAKLINSTPEEVSFIPNTSYGVNIVAHGLELSEGDEIITDNLEFPTVVYPFLKLKNKGILVKIINVKINNFEEDILNNLTKKTKLIAISHVSFNTGLKVDVKKITKEAHSQGALVLLDVIQSAGAIKVDVKDLDVDFAVAGSYKWLMAPHGSGFLYVREGMIKDPPFYGWKTTRNYLDFNATVFELEKGPRRFEIGTLDVSAIAGLAKSCEILSENIEQIEENVLRLSRLVIEEAKSKGLEVITPIDKRAGIVIISARDPKAIVEKLYEKNIIVSARGGGIRISTHFYNTEEEIKKTINIISKYYN
ncbi:MAG: aminotransferase class V-fold PLP-dependent enzyme [Sulfolobaceae archaeon]